MGLDTVELVMVVEETFDITIPNRDAEKIQTVGDLWRYVADRVLLSDVAPCLSAAAFYRVRRALMETFGLAREQVRPGLELDPVVPREVRSEHWKRFGRALGVEPPGLVPTEALLLRLNEAFRLWILTCALGLAAGLVIPRAAWVVLALTILFGGLSGLSVVHLRVWPSASELAPACQTVGNLSHAVAFALAAEEGREEEKWSRATVREAVRSLVIDRLGVSPDVVTDDAHFVYDLGC